MASCIHQYGVFEICLQSERSYTHPDIDCQVTVHCTGSSGQVISVRAFWDGGDTWRARMSPGEIGLWSWETECTPEDDTSLHRKCGSFECTDYSGDNPLYTHGPLKAAQDNRWLCHADGTPFFWLGDTA
jgi:hypothetical protein